MGLKTLFENVMCSLFGTPTTPSAIPLPPPTPHSKVVIFEDDGEEEDAPLIFSNISDLFTQEDECWFGAYVEIPPHNFRDVDGDGNVSYGCEEESTLVWLPYVTSEANVIKQIESLQPGDCFKIVKGVQEGGMGCRVFEIETLPMSPRVQLLDQAPLMTLKLKP